MKILHFITRHRILQNKSLNLFLVVSLLFGLIPFKTDAITNLKEVIFCLICPVIGFGFVSFFINIQKKITFYTAQLSNMLFSLLSYFLGSSYFITFIPHIISLITGSGSFPALYLLTGMVFRLTKSIDEYQ